MIICSCNVISDKQVLSVVGAARHRAPTISQVYAALGCRFQCGRCAPVIKRLRDNSRQGFAGA
jgi:bacterioferritin-associated ferredoxin